MVPSALEMRENLSSSRLPFPLFLFQIGVIHAALERARPCSPFAVILFLPPPPEK